MTSKCPKCEKPVFFAEKVNSLGKHWHRFCLKCERCKKTLSAGGFAEHNGKPYCEKPCYATLFGPKGVNIGGVGSYIYDTPPNTPLAESDSTAASPIVPWSSAQKAKPDKNAEKVQSLGRNWHRPCLRCERCKKTLAAGAHAEHEGRPYCHVPCYGYLFGPKGVNIGNVGCYIYEKEEWAFSSKS
ncbi:cysteine-rich protein 2-like isoform X3 [Arapaima gigas]